MKRTWVVVVGMEAGHELTDLVSESRFYGPFTMKQAERLEIELNKLFEKNRDGEIEIELANAMPLESINPRDLMKKYRNEYTQSTHGA